MDVYINVFLYVCFKEVDDLKISKLCKLNIKIDAREAAFKCLGSCPFGPDPNPHHNNAQLFLPQLLR